MNTKTQKDRIREAEAAVAKCERALANAIALEARRPAASSRVSANDSQGAVLLCHW